MINRPASLPANLGRLTADLYTPAGVFPAGTVLEVLEAGEVDARVCLDQGWHLTGRCHTAIVPRDQIEGHKLTMTMSRQRRVAS